KDTVDFPDTFLRHRNIREITLENNGPDTLRVDTIFCNLPQFDFPKTVITVPGGESETVQIGFTPDSTLFYNGFITIRNNDPVNFNRNLMVRGTGIYSPEIAVTDSLIFYASAVDSQKQVLQIRNDGLGDLNFSLQVVGHKPGEKLNEGTGGTDTFGHIWVDSDEPNGPAFNWISVSDSIVPIAMTGNNSISNAIRMEFPFSFYGVEYNQFRICTNGWISFTTFSVAYNNLFLPDVMAPRSLIAPLWDDLVMNQNSRVFVEQTANKVIVEFRDFYRISGEGPYTFEVILYENNNIILQYLSLDSLMHDYTVGIQDHLATDGLTISCDEPYLKDSLVVMISRHSWLSAEPLSGTVKPGESVDINVNIKTNQFPLGDFFAGIEIESNDPDRELVTVPVHMIVGLTALENRENIIPSRLELFQNYPNPFNPETTIKYSLPEENNVELVVYNLLGQKVKTLVLQRQRAGYHSIAWDGRNDNGAEAGAGVYVYRLKADSRTIIRKMVLVK
ncbi:MAG: T9SS C-terminal target domain-containing protein, partial [Calditrichaeota bacterium]